MIILNTKFDLVDSLNESIHQIVINNIKDKNHIITVHDFTIEETLKYFCESQKVRVIRHAIMIMNIETGNFHIYKIKNSADNIYIIFYEYSHVKLKIKHETKISLKKPLRIIEGKTNNNSYKDYIKYFFIPKSTSFWIKEYSGEYGNNLICYYWDTKELKPGHFDMEEIITDDIISNIVIVPSKKNFFIIDQTCDIYSIMKTYPNMYFKFMYDEFLDILENKFQDFNWIMIMDVDEYNISKQILEQSKNQLPYYICIPVLNNPNSFYSLYKAIEFKQF